MPQWAIAVLIAVGLILGFLLIVKCLERRDRKTPVVGGGEPFLPFGETAEDRNRIILKLYAPNARPETCDTAVTMMMELSKESPVYSSVKSLLKTVGTRMDTLAMCWLHAAAFVKPYADTVGQDAYSRFTVDVQHCTALLFAAAEGISVKRAQELLLERWMLFATAASSGSDALDMYIRAVAEDLTRKANDYASYKFLQPPEIQEEQYKAILLDLTMFQSYNEARLKEIWQKAANASV